MSRTTRIEAINEMLSLIGVNTVASLDDPVRQDAIAAEQTLDEVLKHIATQSYFHNIYEKVTLTPDTDGFIYISDDIYNVELVDDAITQVIIKGDRLYNLTDKTFEWSGPKKFEVQYYLEFTDLPEVIKRYAIMAGARRLYLKLFGPSQHLNALAFEERMAFDIWQRWEFDQGDYNVLTQYDTYRTWKSPRMGGRNSRR